MSNQIEGMLSEGEGLTSRLKYNEARISRLLEMIAESNLENRHYLNSNGLLDGKVGLSLFYFYYYDYTSNEKYFEIGRQLLVEVLKEVKTSKITNPYLSNGLCGIFWCLSHLYEQEFLSDSIIKIFGNQIYDYLEKVVDKAMAYENYDYLHGALGILAFLNSDRINVAAIVERMQGKYDKNGVRDPKRIQTSTSLLWKENLTLAHGEAGFLAVLLQMYRRSNGDTPLKNMIKQASDALVNKLNINNGTISLFPDFITNDFTNDKHTNAKLAWCTGDLSICYVLIDALRISNDFNIMESILAHIKNPAYYIGTSKISDNDIFFCHGSIGHSYLFNKLYQKTKDLDFFVASEYWLNKVCDSLECGAYSTTKETDNFPETLRLGILNGSAGVGLSLITMLSGETGDNNWDKMLLL